MPALHELLQRQGTTSVARGLQTVCDHALCHVVSFLLQGQIMWAAAQAGDEAAAAFLCSQFEMQPGSADWQPAAAMAALAQPPGCIHKAGGLVSHCKGLPWCPMSCLHDTNA